MKALVLTGEGAKGAWQAAAMARHIGLYGYPDFIVGVSSGAINGAIHACNPLTADLPLFWREIGSISQIFAFNWLKALWATGIYNSKPLHKLLNENLLTKAHRMPVHFPIAYASTGLLLWQKNEGEMTPEAIEGLLAATAIPGLVECRQGFVDGGVRALAPVAKAIEHGATDITVIMARPFTVNAPPFDGQGLLFNGRLLKAASYGYRFLDLTMHEIMLRDINVCTNACANVKIRVVSPECPVGDALAFDQCRAMTDLRTFPMKVTVLQ